MLRTFGPGCDGNSLGPGLEIPEGATWIDLEQPTRDEELLVERCLGLEVPTQSEMAEIEPSSRLYEQDGVLYMTISALWGISEGDPQTTPVGFVLSGNRVVTVRSHTPKPVAVFADHVKREPGLARDADTVLLRLLDAFIDRLADELEAVGTDLETISSQIFARKLEARRIPADRLTALLTSIGRTQSLLAKIRYSAVTTSRMLGFLAGSHRLNDPAQGEARNHMTSLMTDVSSLAEHANFLADNVIFLLDASLGLISIEQNAAMKIFSWAAVVFLPPTLIAGIYGMNFKVFPELRWEFGYPVALAMMLASAILPYLYFRRRGLL